MTRPTPSPTARSSSRTVLLLPWKPTRSIGKPARSATVSSPPEHTSRCRPSSASHRTVVVERNALPAKNTSYAANASAKARARSRKSRSSRTYAGLPCSATRSGRLTPPTLSTPSSLAAVDDQRIGTSELGSAGSRSQCGPPGRAWLRAPSAWAQPEGCEVGTTHIRSGAETPSRSSPLASTTRVASTSSSRARCRSDVSSSPRGSTRQLS